MAKQTSSPYQRTYSGSLDIYDTRNNLVERDSIPMPLRWRGMVVFVISEAKEYWLPTADLTNAGWKERMTDGCIKQYDSKDAFPPTGFPEMLYIDVSTSISYFWDVSLADYIPLGGGSDMVWTTLE